MNDRNRAQGEFLPTAGLLLILTAVVGSALFLSSLGTGSGPSMLAAGVAVVAFFASLVCFAADASDSEERLGGSARGAMVGSRTV